MDFPRGLKARGLDGTKLVISDARSGLRAAIERVFGTAWQRCRVHWMRIALAHVSRVYLSIGQPDQHPRPRHYSKPVGNGWPGGQAVVLLSRYHPAKPPP